MPAVAALTLLVSGIPMHRIEDTNPSHDTQSTIKAIAPVAGYVLDTARDLAYTAIEAARTAQQVVTVELDPTVLQIARLNPRSSALSENPRIRPDHRRQLR